MAEQRTTIPSPPKGINTLKWLGPGILWMVSAAGSGELLFSPRVGSLYGYSLIWAMIAAVLFKWFINKEIGRYTVCTGNNIIEGFAQLSQLSVYLILIPQLFVCVVTIAGLAGSSATALVLIIPVNIKILAVAAICMGAILVSVGKFRLIELIATIIASLLSLSAIAAAITIFPGGSEFLKGFIPKANSGIDLGEILPWLGLLLSGAAGLMWYSYWVQQRGYGAAAVKNISATSFSEQDMQHLKGWIKQMTWANNLAVFGTLIITLCFLIMGVELLKPRGLVPEENKVAEVLGKALEQIWGSIGFWFMVSGLCIGFWGTVLSDQDGFGRMFTGGSRLIAANSATERPWMKENVQKKMFVIGICGIAPILLYLIMGEPVSLLKIAGAIEAAHIPFVVVLTMKLNLQKLPKELKPSAFTVIMTTLAGLFFAGFSIIYLLDLFGIIRLK